MMGDDRGVFEDVLGIVEYWVPETDHSRKTGFRDELEEFLRSELNQSRNNPVAMNLGQHEYTIDNTRASDVANITVDGVVGIELVHDFSKQDRETYAGRVQDYSGALDYLVLCACGVDDLSEWQKLKQQYEGRGGVHIGLGDDREIAFVHKEKEDFGENPDDVHGSGGLFGGGGLI